LTLLFSSLAASLSSPLVGDGTLVGRVCRILGYGIGLADVIMLCDLHYILSSVPEIRLTLKASSARKLLELRVLRCTGLRVPPGAFAENRSHDAGQVEVELAQVVPRDSAEEPDPPLPAGLDDGREREFKVHAA